MSSMRRKDCGGATDHGQSIDEQVPRKPRATAVAAAAWGTAVRNNHRHGSQRLGLDGVLYGLLILGLAHAKAVPLHVLEDGKLAPRLLGNFFLELHSFCLQILHYLLNLVDAEYDIVKLADFFYLSTEMHQGDGAVAMRWLQLNPAMLARAAEGCP